MGNRIKNTTRNIVLSYTYLIAQLIFQFVSKSIIVHTLGAQYLGLSGLFTSVLNVLNMTELGFSASIIYNMYKPLAENDTERVCALLNYYKTIYRIVGIIILSIGMVLTPFIPKLINGTAPTEINVYILYLLYLINTSSSYFLFGYSSALLHATQRMDLTKSASTITLIFQNIIQIVVLLLWKNYYVFVIILVMSTVSTNLIYYYYSKKYFPQYVCKGQIEDSVKKNIIQKVKGLLICNLSSVTYTSFDSIIISSFIGLSSVARYTNYMTIFTAVASLITLIRGAMQASVGDSIVKESIEKNYNDMMKWQFLFSIIATVCVTCLVCLYQPFMVLWMGEDMLLSMVDVVLLGVWFLISVVQHSYFLYLTGNGLWNEMKYSYVFSTIFNIVMNIVLGRMMGITGVILASVLSIFISGSIWQCLVIFKEYFNRSPKEYFMLQGKYFFVASVICAGTYYTCSLITLTGWVGLFLKAAICVSMSCVAIWIVYRKTDIYQQVKRIAFAVINRRSSK